MNLFSFNNIVCAIVGAALSGLVGYGLHSWDVDRINSKHEKAMTAAADECKAEKAKIQTQCDADKILTTGVSSDYQTGLITRDHDVADSLLGNDTTPCYSIPATSSVASGSDAANKPNQSGKGGAINRAAYSRFSSQCEDDRLKVNGLQKYVCSVWFSRGAVAANDPICKRFINPVSVKK